MLYPSTRHPYSTKDYNRRKERFFFPNARIYSLKCFFMISNFIRLFKLCVFFLLFFLSGLLILLPFRIFSAFFFLFFGIICIIPCEIPPIFLRLYDTTTHPLSRFLRKNGKQNQKVSFSNTPSFVIFCFVCETSPLPHFFAYIIH